MKKTVLITLLLFTWCRTEAALRVPAFTAYLDPIDGGAWISEADGITGWDNPGQKVSWYGDIKNAGALECSVKVRLFAGTETKLRLGVAGEIREMVVKGIDNRFTNVAFGTFKIAAPGYQRFTLESLNATGLNAGEIKTLILDGPAARDAHFNLESRRNTASVHLAYPTADFDDVDAFYCEVTAVETPVWTYFEACGWQRGYFGMQVNSPTERRIIFSVWDSGAEHISRSKVADPDRVKLVAKGDGVYAGDFGNEGTGGHSHFEYDWKTGEKQRFLVTARPTDDQHTTFSGYWYHPEQKKWMLISSWNAPKDGGYLRGLYSFCEDFNGDNGEVQRKALYGNQWIHTADGQWHEQLTAKFSHDPTGRAERQDRFMGVEDGSFFLSTGGYVAGFTEFGTLFTRPATGGLPPDVAVPPLP